MAGLVFPRELVVEMFLGGGWTDITGDVRQTVPVVITRGRGDEQAKVPPSKLSMTLHNASGNYTPDNPMSVHFGRLGRNTPVRMGLKIARDSFSRTVSNGWGTADAGGVWTVEGTPSDYATTGTRATQSVNGTATFLAARLGSVSLLDVYARVTVSLAVTDITGGAVEPATIMLRGQDAANYYMLRPVVTTTEQVQLQVYRRVAGVDTAIGGTVTVPGLTHSAAQSLTVAGMIEGRTIYGKVWVSTQPEPYDWQIIASDDADAAIVAPGWVGVRSGVAGGNTNVKPLIMSYDDWDVRVIRASGELAELNPRWNESHTDKWATLRAEGVLRRLGQGDSPVRSSLRRAYDTAAVPPVAYWSCEDGKKATSFASAFTGHPPIIFSGNPQLAAYDEFDCSAKLPLTKGSSWFGKVPSYPQTGKLQFRFLMHIPADGLPTSQFLFTLQTTNNTAYDYAIQYTSAAGGSLTFQVSDTTGAVIYSSGPWGFAVNGQLLMVSLELQQSGADIAWTLGTLGVGAAAGLAPSGTIVAKTLGAATSFSFNGGFNPNTAVTFGHITLFNAITSLFDQQKPLDAWAGETAVARFLRLCAENGIPAGYTGNPATTLMGPQQVKTLLALLQECADAEQGILSEPRSTNGLQFRTRASLYSQRPRLTLDYALGHVAPALEPTPDDQGTRNDVLAKRLDGSEYRAVQLSGPLNVNNPWTDPQGVGRYDTSVNVNVRTDAQLPGVAEWSRHLGTRPEARYPTVSVNLAAPDITTAIASDALSVGIGERLVVKNLTAADIYGDIDQLVQGYAETYTNAHLQSIVFTATPYSPYKILTLNTDRLDGDKTTLNANLTAIATAVDVQTAAGSAPWTTSAGDRPFDIVIGGERMTVTNVTGAGSLQTMTVTRSVNGVVKTHSIGAAVRLADTVYLGR